MGDCCKTDTGSPDDPQHSPADASTWSLYRKATRDEKVARPEKYEYSVPQALDVPYLPEKGERYTFSMEDAPTHYASESGMQAWDVIEAFDLDFWSGNALKYIIRAGKKDNRLEDLKKARHFVDYLIEREERK